MKTTLTQKTVFAIIWSFLERFGVKGISLLFSILLARILTPDDYGIVAMPMIFLSLAHCLVDCGFGEAIIRKEQLNSEDINTAFIFNVSLSLVLYIGLFILAPLIADFYQVSVLRQILRISSFSVLLAPWCMVQKALLIRQLQFKCIGIIGLVSSLISGFVGLFMAMCGCGVWSLIVQTIGTLLIEILLLWINSPYRPKLEWSEGSFRYLWNYGSRMLFSSILNIISLNTLPVVIGKIYSPFALGNFMKGATLSLLPSQQITDVIQRVTFPVFCKLQSDNLSMERNFRKILKYISFVSFPLSFGMIAAAKPIVGVVLGNQWGGVVPIMQLLCLGSLFFPFHAINLDVLRAKGRSDLFMYLEFAKSVLGIVALFYVYDKGIMYMTASVVVLSISALCLNTMFAKKFINVGLARQLLDVFPMALVAGVMAVCIIMVNHVVDSVYLAFVLDIIIGILVYMALSKILFREVWRELLLILKNSLQKNNR